MADAGEEIAVGSAFAVALGRRGRLIAALGFGPHTVRTWLLLVALHLAARTQHASKTMLR